MGHPLYVALYWHMHQPLYRSALTGDYNLPWARLHGSKDYLHMAELAAQYPQVHQNFNFVPSLLDQLEDYGEHGASDRWMEVSLRERFSTTDRAFVLEQFFGFNWDKVIGASPAYRRLYSMREVAKAAPEAMPDQYFRDVAAWFNLSWIDPEAVARDPELRKLRERGAYYSLADLQLIIEKQREIIRGIVPAYRKLEADGVVEVTTSAYYHPILPLLIDIEAARVASPNLDLPLEGISWPEDAFEQLRKARERHEECFGYPPRGLWPSEGSVSPQLLETLRGSAAFRWLASDEAILARSLGTWFERDGAGVLLDPWRLYQPYLSPDGETAIIFRDRDLSDRIGFVYQNMPGVEAADDLMQRLYNAQEKLNDPEQPYLVSIVLDGENCWETYEANGNPFMHRLLSRLSNEDRIKTVTLSEYLDWFPVRERLPQLFSGSWINNDFETWVGQQDQNIAWDYLARTRARLVSWQNDNCLADVEVLSRAWAQIYISEGSDWFWWYCDRNRIDQAPMFDVEFRGRLADVYSIIGLPTPDWLKRPIESDSTRLRPPAPASRITPEMTAAEKPSAGWGPAAVRESSSSTGSMQKGGAVLRRLRFGNDPDDFYLRLEGAAKLDRYRVAVYFTTGGQRSSNRLVRFDTGVTETGNKPLGWEYAVEDGQLRRYQAGPGESWQEIPTEGEVRLEGRVIEARVPLRELESTPGDSMSFVVAAAREDVVVEQMPSAGYVSLRLL